MSELFGGSGGGGGASPLTTKGDIYIYSTADARLGIGTNGYRLEADSALTAGVGWKPTDIGCWVYRNTTTAFNTSSATYPAFNTEVYDTDNMWEGVTHPDRVTINTPGKYMLMGAVSFSTAGGSSTWMSCFEVTLAATGTVYLGEDLRNQAPSATNYAVFCAVYNFAQGDFVRCYNYQTSGTNLTLNAGSAAAPMRQGLIIQKIDKAG
jgi:hypothetical protein